MKETLEADPPNGARVSFEPDHAASGWNAPDIAPWLHASLEKGSQAAYGQGVMYMGEGGTIPFMAMLGDFFPRAQFMITARKLTSCVAQVIADHFNRKSE